MPYPVPPPEPSAIIYIAKPQKVALTVAAGDGDTLGNPAEIPEASPEILQPPQPTAQTEGAPLLGTTPATSSQPLEIADPLTAVESGDAVVRFGRPIPVGKPETAQAQKDSSFTAYKLGSIENAVAARNRQRTAAAQRKADKNAIEQPDNWYQAKGQQLQDNSPEPAEIIIPEPTPE
ncbi:MAG: DUF3769 domain-containing protein, partial [Microcoleus sp.]